MECVVNQANLNLLLMLLVVMTISMIIKIKKHKKELTSYQIDRLGTHVLLLTSGIIALMVLTMTGDNQAILMWGVYLVYFLNKRNRQILLEK